MPGEVIVRLRLFLRVLGILAASQLTVAQVTCPSGACVSPDIPVFTNTTASSTPTVTNSSLQQKTGNPVVDTTGLAVVGPGPWIDVTAPFPESLLRLMPFGDEQASAIRSI